MYNLFVVAPAGAPRLELVHALDREGMDYSPVTDAAALARVSVGQTPDAVLLDLATPSSDALDEVAEQCQALRLPLLVVLTPEAMAGWELGHPVDDFILCPPRPGEVRARVRQALKRFVAPPLGEVVRVGDLVIDLHRYDVYVGERKVLLTYKEYQLLKLLASNPGRVYSREALMSQIWGYDYFGGTRTVDVHIRRLRSKIEDADHTFIETVWNVGYRLRG